ncbi:MAG: exodeoxyribonuclease large subunit [Sphingomonadales bacterium]|nr:exodeoxyribonuclease large subunit [Sphingomonadales bacterium]
MDDLTDFEARLIAESAPGDNAAPLSVSELSSRLKRHVEDGFGRVRIRGEISGWKRVASGHCYLALKDEKAVIDGVMWKATAAALAFAPEDGADVIATGKLTIYPGRSKYQIVIERLELAGAGAMLALLEKLKAKLAGEGLFDAARKKTLPYLPRTIGVVTSPTGAVIRDILHRLSDRFPVRVIVWPVIVQGNGAAQAVANAVDGFSAMQGADRPDLVIVARGGGSVEDLWAFNEEVAVRAVAACTIPIISAVGHETDTSLCDFAADVRAPTPTAAAEMAVPVRSDLLGLVQELSSRTLRCAHRYHDHGGERLRALTARLPKPDALLGPQRQRTDDLGGRLRRGLGHRLAEARGDVARASGALRPALLQHRLGRAQERLAGVRLEVRLVERPIAQARDQLDRLWRVAQSLHPNKPLERGYAWVEKRGGGVVTSVAAAQAAGALTLHFGDGPVDVSVEGAARAGRVERAARTTYNKPQQDSLF